MQFQFDANQEHQIKAIEATIGLFDGQNVSAGGVAFTLGVATIPNQFDLEVVSLLENLRQVQTDNKIMLDESLQFVESDVEISGETKRVSFANFSVEMETGTGKTYVYIRTALELFQKYGFRKFIIVVPSIAVKEGVMKSFEQLKVHLRELFGSIPYRYYVYSSDSLTIVRQFALSDSLEFMIMTIDSFNKASNVIRQSTDRLHGETPINLIQLTQPILILDEPQNMESKLSLEALCTLNPLFALRYSATHRNPYNLIYRLSPFDAYCQGLVKRIEVDSIIKEADANQTFIRLEEIITVKKKLVAKVALHKLMKGGAIKEVKAKLCIGNNLRKITKLLDYEGYVVNLIDKSEGYVRFTNNFELRTGDSIGDNKQEIFETQIRQTIETHFRRQEKLKPLGVKVLSLFFIDRVDNYTQEDGFIKLMFNRLFNEVKSGYPDWQDVSVERVQAAYFAQKRRKGGTVEFLDTRGESEADQGAYELIMKAKERLLSFDEPVSFIFSHSALREGWDNPNVFQICTLNQTKSEMKKRQEIGRGVRLCVNQEGKRLFDEKANVLTVIANESYEQYVQTLQSEIRNDYGLDAVPPKLGDARKRGTVKFRKEYTLSPEFKELWEQIKYKTRYSVNVDTEKLLKDTLPAIDSTKITPPRINVIRAQVIAFEQHFEAFPMMQGNVLMNLAGRIPLPNIIPIMANLMENTTPPMKLSFNTLLELVKRTKNKQALLDNPNEFATVAVRLLKEKISDQLVEGIQYEKINEWYEMTQLEDDFERWTDYLVKSEKSVYDYVEFDSGVEREFVEGLERRDDVLLYLKLPKWFTVDTPIGKYNPDWAIVMKEINHLGDFVKNLYLVREIKSSWRPDDLRPNELRKVNCGKAHFNGALKVDFKIATSVAELP